MIEPVEQGAVVVDTLNRSFVRFDPNPRSKWAWVSSSGVVTSWQQMLEPKLLRPGMKMEPPPEPVRTHSSIKDADGNVYTKLNDGFWHGGAGIKNWENLAHPVTILFEGA